MCSQIKGPRVGLFLPLNPHCLGLPESKIQFTALLPTQISVVISTSKSESERGRCGLNLTLPGGLCGNWGGLWIGVLPGVRKNPWRFFQEFCRQAGNQNSSTVQYDNENWNRLPGYVVEEHMLRILPVTQNPMWPQTSNLISQFLFLNLQEGVPAGVTE